MPLPLFNKNTCSQCGNELIPREHWRCCPNCEPQMFPNYIPEGYALVPKPTLLHVGAPHRPNR